MDTNLEAATQRQDMEGSVALDWQGESDLGAFARKHGVNTDLFFPIAVEFYIAEGLRSAAIYAADLTLAPDGAAGLERYARAHGGKVPVRKFNAEVSLADFIASSKRFELVAKSGFAKNFEMQIQHEE